MPFYRFMIHGRAPEGADGPRGLYTHRHAFASTQERAAAKVVDRLRREFTTGVSAGFWGGKAPEMTIEGACRIGVHQLRWAPNRGSTFYAEDE